MKKIIITTSWDDGHPLDIKLANILYKFGIKGTFYIPQSNEKKQIMNKNNIKTLISLGMEVGAHTLSHPDLTKLNQNVLRKEIVESKKYLEQIIGESVNAFCYPKGLYNQRVKQEVIKAGFLVARTTNAFYTTGQFDHYALPVSMHYSCYKDRLVIVRHGLKHGNIIGLYRWLRFFNRELDPFLLLQRIFDTVAKQGGILHVWGHSWEIDKYNLWGSLYKALEYIVQKHKLECIGNSELSSFPKKI